MHIRITDDAPILRPRIFRGAHTGACWGYLGPLGYGYSHAPYTVLCIEVQYYTTLYRYTRSQLLFTVDKPLRICFDNEPPKHFITGSKLRRTEMSVPQVLVSKGFGWLFMPLEPLTE